MICLSSYGCTLPPTTSPRNTPSSFPTLLPSNPPRTRLVTVPAPLLVVASIQKRSQEWHELELVARKTSGQNRLFSRHLKRSDDYAALTKKRCGCIKAWRAARKMQEAADDFQYALLRQRFMECGYTGNDPLDPDFDFAGEDQLVKAVLL